MIIEEWRILDTAIEKFLSERKADRIKKKLKANMLEHEKLLIEQEADKEFLLENWLPKAAKRAGQLSLASHPAKFSHPSAKSKSVIFSGDYRADGFLRSGNVNVEPDVFGSASAMDVLKFLLIQLDDGLTVLEHLESGSEDIKNKLNITTASFDELQNGFLAIKQCTEIELTDSKIKQVYFPVENKYHLLSIMIPSGLIYKLKDKISDIRFSDSVKQAREDRKKQLYNEEGFGDIYGLSMIGYGGTKPQNISVLNSTYGGKAYLVPSFPPTLKHKYLRLPQHDFFVDSLWHKNFSDEFKALHKLFSIEYNNKDIRNSRDNWLQFIIDKVINKMWSIRLAEPGWSSKASCQLPSYQKIWLDNARQAERQKENDWLNEVMNGFARWIVIVYEKVIGKKAKLLADEDLAYIKKLIEQNKEGLR